MATYRLSVSLLALGFDVVEGARVRIDKRRAAIADTYPPTNNLNYFNKATNEDGETFFLLEPDDSSTYHVAKIFDLAGIPIYEKPFSMPPEDANLEDSAIGVTIGGSLIQFQHDGVDLGTPTTVRYINFLGSGVSADYEDTTATFTISGGGGTGFTKPVPTKQTTSFAFASSNIVCRWDAGVSGAKTISLPATPADGDTVELWDNEESSVYGGSGITTLTVIASAGTYIIANPLTSYDVLSGQGGVSGMGIRFVYRISSLTWSVQFFYADRFNSLDWYLEDGTNSARSIKYSLSALTAQRIITVPDAAVNLGKIPTALSYSASTGTLTHTNTDTTTLTATIKTTRSLDYALSDQTTAIATGTPLTCRVPYNFTITSVKASLKTAQASGSLFTLDIKKNGTSIFSTLLTFDNTEKTTATAATAAVLSSTTLADDDELTFIVTQVGDGTAIGLVAYIIGYPT